MAFATASDLATYLNKSDMTAGEVDQANMLLDIATGAIQREVGQTIEYVAADVAVLRGNYGSVLVLPERPVLSVSAVSINGTSLTVSTDYVWDGATSLYRGRRFFNNQYQEEWFKDRTNLHWGGEDAQVSVTYTHGFAELPPDVIGVCLDLAARAVNSPAGIKAETLGSYSVTYEQRSAAGRLTAEDRRQLRWLKR